MGVDQRIPYHLGVEGKFLRLIDSDIVPGFHCQDLIRTDSGQRVHSGILYNLENQGLKDHIMIIVSCNLCVTRLECTVIKGVNVFEG